MDEVYEIAFNDLSSWLNSQPENTSVNPYKLNITGLTPENCGQSTTSGTLGHILRNYNTRFVDLSYTEIPDSVTSMSQTFIYCTSLVKAPVIPDSVTNMSYTFYNCTSLVEAPVIPDSVTNMLSTFYGCASLTEAPVIPDSVTNMGSTFVSCTSLVEASIIPNSVTDMVSTFYGCASLKIVKGIEGYVSGCSNMFTGVPSDCKIFVKYSDLSSWKRYSSTSGAVSADMFIPYLTISELPTYLNSLAVNTVDKPYPINVVDLTQESCGQSYKPGTLGDILSNYNTRFVDLSYTEIPDSVTNMRYTFDGCTSLTATPEIPNSVTNMESTFYDCTSLVEAPVIPDSVTNMLSTFYGCASLTEAPVIPDSVTNMRYTFEGCTSLLKAPVIPDSVTDMENTFRGCTSLTKAPIIPDSVTNMSYTFKDCTSLVEAPVIPNSVTDMSYTFSDCTSLTEAPIIPDSVTNMDFTFSGCTSLTEAPVIPDSVTDMSYTFKDCYNLRNVKNIPKSCTRVSNLFTNCSSLESIDRLSLSEDVITRYASNMFDGANPDLKARVPYSCLSLWNSISFTGFTVLEDTFSAYITINDVEPYLNSLPDNTPETSYELDVVDLVPEDLMTASREGTLGSHLRSVSTKYVDLSYTKIPDSVTSMRETFSRCTSLVKVPVIPNSVTNMDFTFYGCTSLTAAPAIPNSVTSMSSTFGGCTSLTEAPVIPDSVTRLYFTFSGCASLTEAPVIPDSVTDISYAFRDCTSLTEAPVIPNSVTNIEGTFLGWTSLTEAPVIPNSVTNMSYTFKDCTSLVEAPVIPNSVTNMDSTFYGCKSLVKAPIISNSVTNMQRTFDGCTSLTENITIPPSVIRTNEIFYNCGNISSIDIKCDLPKDCKNSFYGTSENLIINVEKNYYKNWYGEDKELLSLTSRNSLRTEIPFTEFSDFYTELPASTIEEPYNVKITGSIDSSQQEGSLGNILVSRDNGFINLSRTELTDADLTKSFENCANLIQPPVLSLETVSLNSTFKDCENLEYMPDVPFNVTDMDYSFYNCRKIPEVKTLPDSVVTMNHTFENCESITEIVNIPANLKTMNYTYTGTSITESPSIPSSVVSMEGTFMNSDIVNGPILSDKLVSIKDLYNGCTELKTAQGLPASVKNCENAFKGCVLLQDGPQTVIPNGAENIERIFDSCESLTVIQSIPATVTKIESAFEGCTNLQYINYWGVKELGDLETYANVFKDCGSIIEIKVPKPENYNSEAETSKEWHFYVFDFNEDKSCDVRIYTYDDFEEVGDKKKFNYKSIKIGDVTGKLSLGYYTDEFIAAEKRYLTDEIIDKFLTTKVNFTFNTQALDPLEKNFVLWADNPDAFKSNLLQSFQADWNEEDTQSSSYIRNKPDISGGGVNAKTTEEYEELPAEEKDADKLYLLTDAENGFLSVTDEVEKDNNSVVTSGGVFDALSTLGISIGTIEMWSSEVIPQGWFECDGRQLYVSDYPELFDKIGYTYGGKDGIFLLPDFKTKAPWDTSETAQSPTFTCIFIIKAVNTTAQLDEDADIDDTKATTGNVWSASKTNSEIEKSNSYSTEETLTGGTWIDGKPIYRKAGYLASAPSKSLNLLDSSLNTENVNNIINSGGSVMITNNTRLCIGGYSGDEYRLNVSLRADGLSLMSSDNAYTDVSWWVEYTKTTD